MVFAATVLRGRLATIVVQLTAGIRLFQYQPPRTAPHRRRPRRCGARSTWSASCSPAGSTARASSRSSSRPTDDPFVGCLSGYVLLRLGLMEELSAVAERVIQTAPQLSDGVRAARRVRRRGRDAGEAGVRGGRLRGRAALWRRAHAAPRGPPQHDIQHPRSAIVRFVFQNHMRGSMWSVFTPRRSTPAARRHCRQSGYEA